jgi:hypothetical protein
MLVTKIRQFATKEKRLKIAYEVRELALILRNSVVDILRPRGARKLLNPSSANSQSHTGSWDYESEVVLPVAFLGSGISPSREDKVVNGSTVKTYFEYRIATLTDAVIYSNGVSHVSVFGNNGARIKEFSNSKYTRFYVSQKLKLRVGSNLAGTSLSLYGNVENTAGNYFHWMVDGISRLLLAKQYHAIDDFDHFLVPKLKYDFQRQSLIALGIPNSKIVEIDVLECVRCDSLVVVTAPRGTGSSVPPGWLIDGFRKALLPGETAVKKGKRIYISRRDAGGRKFTNEDEIVTCLEALGFEAVQMSEYDFNEKIALFADAEVVVGLNGAGLTNVMFCASSVVVIELLPDSLVNYIFASMCCYLKLDYTPLIFSNSTSGTDANKYHGNFELEKNILFTTVEAAIKRQGLAF